MSKLKFLIIFLFLPVSISSQYNYIISDSGMTVNVKLINANDVVNSQICQIKSGEEILQYTPYEVKEFGFKNGRLYVSREIQVNDTGQRVFLERLVAGENTLYYYKGKNVKTFFLEKDSLFLVEIHKRDYETSDSILFPYQRH